jgi:hypothetical protein
MDFVLFITKSSYLSRVKVNDFFMHSQTFQHAVFCVNSYVYLRLYCSAVRSLAIFDKRLLYLVLSCSAGSATKRTARNVVIWNMK